MYKPERSLTILAKKTEANIKRSSSMFISQVKRQPHSIPKHVVEVAEVQYDAKTGTISDNIQKKVEQGLGNPLLANLKAKRHQAAVARGTHFGFSSAAERFPER